MEAAAAALVSLLAGAPARLKYGQVMVQVLDTNACTSEGVQNIKPDRPQDVNSLLYYPHAKLAITSVQKLNE